MRPERDARDSCDWRLLPAPLGVRPQRLTSEPVTGNRRHRTPHRRHRTTDCYSVAALPPAPACRVALPPTRHGCWKPDTEPNALGGSRRMGPQAFVDISRVQPLCQRRAASGAARSVFLSGVLHLHTAIDFDSAVPAPPQCSGFKLELKCTVEWERWAST